MKCPDCGSENKDNAVFCKICGTPLKIQKKQPSEKLAESEESLKETSNNLSIANNIEKSNKSSGNKNALIICVTAIICVAIVAGAFLILNGDILSNPANETIDNSTADNVSDVNQANESKDSTSSSSSNEMDLNDAKKLMKGSSNTVIRNTFDEADADGDGVLTGSEIDRFKYLADLTDRTADTSNTEHVEASDQGAGDGTTKTRYCTTHGRVAVGDDNRCPYCEAEGLDSRTVKGSTEYI